MSYVKKSPQKSLQICQETIKRIDYPFEHSDYTFSSLGSLHTMWNAFYEPVIDQIVSDSKTANERSYIKI